MTNKENQNQKNQPYQNDNDNQNQNRNKNQNQDTDMKNNPQNKGGYTDPNKQGIPHGENPDELNREENDAIRPERNKNDDMNKGL